MNRLVFWAILASGVVMLVVGACLYAKIGNISGGYVLSNCTASAGGGQTNSNSYCDSNCKKCGCRLTCCDYNVTMTFASELPIDKKMLKRSCKSKSPCDDYYRQLLSLSWNKFDSSFTFPCLYNRDKESSSFYCLDIPCNVVTLNEHKDLVNAELTYKQLEPLWIVLMILGGLVLLILIPLEVVMMCKSKAATVDPVTDPDQTEEGEK
jgi:hypothetical protein